MDEDIFMESSDEAKKVEEDGDEGETMGADGGV